MGFDAFNKGPDSDENIYSLNHLAFPEKTYNICVVLRRITMQILGRLKKRAKYSHQGSV